MGTAGLKPRAKTGLQTTGLKDQGSAERRFTELTDICAQECSSHNFIVLSHFATVFAVISYFYLMLMFFPHREAHCEFSAGALTVITTKLKQSE